VCIYNIEPFEEKINECNLREKGTINIFATKNNDVTLNDLYKLKYLNLIDRDPLVLQSIPDFKALPLWNFLEKVNLFSLIFIGKSCFTL
jgi:hypothetical protein